MIQKLKSNSTFLSLYSRPQLPATILFVHLLMFLIGIIGLLKYSLLIFFHLQKAFFSNKKVVKNISLQCFQFSGIQFNVHFDKIFVTGWKSLIFNSLLVCPFLLIYSVKWTLLLINDFIYKLDLINDALLSFWKIVIF